MSKALPVVSQGWPETREERDAYIVDVTVRVGYREEVGARRKFYELDGDLKEITFAGVAGWTFRSSQLVGSKVEETTHVVLGDKPVVTVTAENWYEERTTRRMSPTTYIAAATNEEGA